MHFWIDKRSQCGYSGRRVPSSLSAGVGRTRRDRHLKPMVTPVHRFQSVECVAGAARRPGGVGGRAPLSAHRPPQHNANLQTHSASRATHVHRHNYNGGGLTTGSVLLDVAETAAPAPTHLQQRTYHQFVILASFSLIIVVLIGTKFYFEGQVRGDKNGIWYCVSLVLFVVCAGMGALCRWHLLNTLERQYEASVSQQPPPASVSELGLSGMLSPVAPVVAPPPAPHSSPPPPPYHIAVLLPSTEAPPPTYEKAIS